MKERLLKVYNLAVQGSPGEKENAQALLAKLLTKHGWTIDDLLSEEKRRVSYRFKGAMEERLLLQTVSKCTGQARLTCWSTRGKRGLRHYLLTAAEEAEVSFLYEEYREALKKELDRTLKAFVQANGIFSHGGVDEIERPSAKELEELRRILERASCMGPLPLNRKRLTEGGTR